jgi:hypothetical protein
MHNISKLCDFSNDLFVGKHENAVFPDLFKGVIDEIRIHDKAITNQKVGYSKNCED